MLPNKLYQHNLHRNRYKLYKYNDLHVGWERLCQQKKSATMHMAEREKWNTQSNTIYRQHKDIGMKCFIINCYYNKQRYNTGLVICYGNLRLWSKLNCCDTDNDFLNMNNITTDLLNKQPDLKVHLAVIQQSKINLST